MLIENQVLAHDTFAAIAAAATVVAEDSDYLVVKTDEKFQAVIAETLENLDRRIIFAPVFDDARDAALYVLQQFYIDAHDDTTVLDLMTSLSI